MGPSLSPKSFTNPPLLSMQGISKRFGATQALAGVSLEVAAGEVLALIGENGAGKSTLVKVLSGAHAPDEGRIELAGHPFAPRGPHQARLAGIAMVYQELNLAADLNVEDNVMLGYERHTGGWLRRQDQRRVVRQALSTLGHGDLDPRTLVRRLPIAARQIVELARALVLDAKVVVFDEPTSSLTRFDVDRLFDVIRALRRNGMAIIYISHFLDEVRAVADRYLVLRDGSAVAQGPVAGTSESTIVAQMVGRTVDELFPRVPHEPGPEMVRIDRLSGRGSSPHGLTLDLRKGEILGIFGLVGAGRTELLRCLLGLDRARAGTVSVGGAVCGHSVRARMRAGLGLVSEDRKQEGLSQGQSIVENLTSSRLEPYSRLGWLNLRLRRAAAQQWMNRLAIRARGAEQVVRDLSGGNQQKVALARVLHQDASVLLLDEPTRGIDVATKAEIYRLIGTLAAQGKSILFVSSYLPELLAVCDRLAVMARGTIREIRPVADWSQEAVMACAVAKQ